MRNLRLLWIEIKILFEFFKDEILDDIVSLFKTTTNKETYLTFLKDLLSIFKSLFFKPKNQVYWSIFLIVIAFAKFGFYIKIISILLFIYTYFCRKIWSSGEPLKRYKEKYYSKT